MNNECKIIKLKSFTDSRGTLTPVESASDIPFDINRVFFIKAKAGAVRGEHASNCSEVIFNTSGSCKIETDNGKEKKVFELSEEMTALYIPPMVWKKLYDFSDDCVLAVLSDKHYSPADTVSDYNEFLKLIK